MYRAVAQVTWLVDAVPSFASATVLSSRSTEVDLWTWPWEVVRQLWELRPE